MIYGHSLKSTLVAIIIPDELASASWAESKGISESFEELCKRDDLKEEIMKQVGRGLYLNLLKFLHNLLTFANCFFNLSFPVQIYQMFRLQNSAYLNLYISRPG